MPGNRWLDRTQPQTLFIAVVLLYISAFFHLIGGFVGLRFPLGVLVIAGEVGAGFGIANEKKWGYGLALVMAIAPLVLWLVFGQIAFATDLIGLMFEIALVALLLHPQSREYQRIWFK
jgi:hypothetical protein